MDSDVFAALHVLVRRAVADFLPAEDQDVADQPAERHPENPPCLCGKCLLAEGAIGGDRVALEVCFSLECNEPFRMHEASKHADREGATAESEHPDAIGLVAGLRIFGLIIVAKEFVEV